MFKSFFRRTEDSRTTIANNIEELEQQIIEKLQNWNPPKKTVNDVYRKGTFGFRPQYAIKEVQKTLSIQNEFEDFPLLGRNAMLGHMKKFLLLHVGLIQVAVKPLTFKGLNSSVLISLHDRRFLDFNASLLAVAESSLCYGPIYFNCYPNFSICLQDFRSCDVFTLNIKTHGFQRDRGIRDIAIEYKVFYKVITTPYVDIKAKFDPSVGKTTFIQTNLLASNVAVSKTIQWDSVEVPEEWRDQQPSPSIDEILKRWGLGDLTQQ